MIQENTKTKQKNLPKMKSVLCWLFMIDICNDTRLENMEKMNWCLNRSFTPTDYHCHGANRVCYTVGTIIIINITEL